MLDLLLQAKSDVRALRVMVSLLALYRLAAKANFDPAQPRIPRGQPDGGRWTDGDDEAVLVAQGPSEEDARQADRIYLVNLQDHENREGAHTIARHVGKTDAHLLRRLNTERMPGLFYSLALLRAATFASLSSANRLVSSTLAQNREIVDRVVQGELSGAFLTANFAQITGHEYYRDRTAIRIFTSDPIRHRVTYGVAVAIRHDPAMPQGFLIVTDYPRPPE